MLQPDHGALTEAGHLAHGTPIAYENRTPNPSLNPNPSPNPNPNPSQARKAIDRQAGLGTSAPKEGVDVERMQLQETFLLQDGNRSKDRTMSTLDDELRDLQRSSSRPVS